MRLKFTVLVGCLIFFAVSGFARQGFTENKGQWPSQFDFRWKGQGSFLYIAEQELHWALYDQAELNKLHEHATGAVAQAKASADKALNAQGVRVSFIGARSAAWAGHQASAVHYNYLLAEAAATDVQRYQLIVAEDVYEGIDLHFFQKEALKYEWHVAAGAVAENIKWRYSGQNSLEVTEGIVRVETELGQIIEQPPVSYQLVAGDTVFIETEYVLEKGELSFAFPQGYNKALPLVIDPVLIFSSYSGGESDNWGATATYDSEGHLYAGGISFGQEFPVTTGAFQVNFSALFDVSILKFAPDGTTLQYGTFIGGTGVESVTSLIVNSQNELVLLGTTSSSDFPVSAQAYQQSFAGGDTVNVVSLDYDAGSDLFIAKLSENGSTLTGSTYLGGSRNEGVLVFPTGLAGSFNLVMNYGDELRGEVVVDAQDNIYIASFTNSADFPVSANAWKRQLNSSGGGSATDGLVARFSPDLQQLNWASFVGGGSHDAAYGLRVNNQQQVWATGITMSNNLLDASINTAPFHGGITDGFIVQISADGTQALAGEYLGTEQRDGAFLVGLDSAEQPVIYGQSLGSYPVTAGTYSNDGGKMFVHKLNATADATLFSTVLGSEASQPDISPTAFLVNTCGYIYLAGWGGRIKRTVGNMAGLPVTAEAIQPTTDGSDFYIAILNTDASELLYGTFYGGTAIRGEHVDGGTSRFSPDGVIYHTVCSCITADNDNPFPTTPGAFSEEHRSSNCNMAAFKIDLEVLEASFEASTAGGCVPQTVSFTNSSSGAFRFTWEVNGVVQSNEASFTTTFNEAGEYEVKLTAINPTLCDPVAVQIQTITVSAPTDRTIAASPEVICTPGSSTELTATGGVLYEWEAADGLTNLSGATVTATPSEPTTYTVTITDANGCISTEQIAVTVLEEPVNAAFSFTKSGNCGEGPTLNLINESTGADTYFWELSTGQNFTTENPQISFDQQQREVNIRLVAAANGCTSVTEQTIIVRPVGPPNLFTPNGDGKNDFLTIGTEVNNFELVIFNRWGDKVYQERSYQNDWDGDNLPAGAYYYILYSPDRSWCKGYVNISR